MTTASKVLSLNAAVTVAESLKYQGKRIVTINGVFDLLSVAHLRYLEAAKNEGDVLIVGVNSDASVRALKGPKRPIVPEDRRALLVAGLACTDIVFLFDDPDPRAWLTRIRPDCHVNSSEYGAQCVEAETMRGLGGRLVLLERSLDIPSTSDTVRLILERYGSA